MSIKIYVKYVKNNRDFYTTKMNLPTGNLDMAMGNEVIKFLKKMNELYNQTIVIVTHDQDIAAQMDRIITIADGSVINDKEVCIKNSCKK